MTLALVLCLSWHEQLRAEAQQLNSWSAIASEGTEDMVKKIVD